MIKDIALLSPLYVTFFWGIVLLASYNKSKPKFLLGIFMFVAFLLYLTHAFFFNQNYLAYFHTECIYLFTSLAVYPIYYCYIRALTIDCTFHLKNLIHFVPAILFALASFITDQYFTHEQSLEYVKNYVMQRDISGFNLLSASGIKNGIYIICRVIFIFQVFFYLLNGMVLTQQHERRISNYYSNSEGKSMFWVRMVTFTFLITSVMSITFAIIGRTFFQSDEFLLLIPSVIFSSLLFIIGFLGSITKQFVIDASFIASRPKSSRIHDSEIMKQKILQLFKDDKIFKNPDLLITNLSDKLKSPSTEVTQLINDEFKTDFSDFVNKYRISIAKELIVKNINNGLTLFAIAVESGFGSVNSFTRVFKSYEGITPEKYIEICRQKNIPLQ